MRIKFYQVEAHDGDYWYMKLQPNYSGGKGGRDMLFMSWVMNHEDMQFRTSVWHENMPDLWLRYVTDWMVSFRLACENKHYLNEMGGFAPSLDHLKVVNDKYVNIDTWSKNMIQEFWDKVKGKNNE